jgi:hypothetical protein
MKNTIILIVVVLLFSSTILGQNSWEYGKEGNAFDGTYKYAFVEGKGSRFPYNDPTLIVRLNDNGEYAFFLNNSGFYQNEDDVDVYWAFNKGSSGIYHSCCSSIMLSKDGSAIFFEDIKTPENEFIDMFSFLELMMESSDLSIRVSSKYSNNTISISLRGSSRAIDYVMPKTFRDSVRLKKQHLIEKKIDENRLKQTLYQKLFRISKDYGLDLNSLDQLNGRFKQDLGIGQYPQLATGEPYDSISVVADFESSRFQDYGYVDVSYVMTNGSKKNIIGTFKVKSDSPLMTEYLVEVKRKEQEKIKQQELLAKEQNRIYLLLEKFGREDIKQFMLKSILEEAEKDKFSLQSINSINAIFSEFLGGEILYLKILLLLEENKEYQLVTLPRQSDVYISKRDLKKLGAKVDEPF